MGAEIVKNGVYDGTQNAKRGIIVSLVAYADARTLRTFGLNPLRHVSLSATLW